MMEMGTNSSGAIIKEEKSTMGPSAPPIVAIAADCSGVSPKASTPAASAAKVPISAKMAIIMELQGFASKKLISLRAPMPMKTRQAIRPLEKVRL